MSKFLGEDVIDSRDIIERIEELQAGKQEMVDDVNSCEISLTKYQEWQDDNEEELSSLLKLQEQAEYSPDWEYGETLIHEDYFETYMDEMVADCYDLPKDLPFWMNITYDYDALKTDYFEVDFGGETYFIRN